MPDHEIIAAFPSSQLPHVGTYRRVLPVSLVRMYENTLDWEHLPFVHDSSFSSIECLGSCECADFKLCSSAKTNSSASLPSARPPTATGPQAVPRRLSVPPELVQLKPAGAADAGEGELVDGIEERKPMPKEEGMMAEDQGDGLMSNRSIFMILFTCG